MGHKSIVSPEGPRALVPCTCARSSINLEKTRLYQSARAGDTKDPRSRGWILEKTRVFGVGGRYDWAEFRCGRLKPWSLAEDQLESGEDEDGL